MDFGIWALLLLIVAIVLGFLRKTNVGLVALLFAFVFGHGIGLSNGVILKGFNPNLFITLMGVTLLFSILNNNGTIEILAKKIVALAGTNNFLIPIAIYLIGMGLTTIGPGSIPILAIMPAFAIPIAKTHGYNPLMLAIIGDCGAFSGRMSTITPEGILTYDFLLQGGITAEQALVPMYVNQCLSGFLLAVMVFVYYKGYKTNKAVVEEAQAEVLKFNKKQWLSLLGLVTLAVSVIGFKLNVGLVAFSISAVLLCANAGNENKSIKGIPWGVLIMISGVSTLMGIVSQTGGITVLIAVLSAFMTPGTAAAVMGATAGIMSLFSSGLGVVFPTLLPTVVSVAESVGNVNPIELASMVIIGGTITGLSPISSTGGLILAILMSEEEDNAAKERHLFLSLVGWGCAALVLVIVLALSGIYTLAL